LLAAKLFFGAAIEEKEGSSNPRAVHDDSYFMRAIHPYFILGIKPLADATRQDLFGGAA